MEKQILYVCQSRVLSTILFHIALTLVTKQRLFPSALPPIWQQTPAPLSRAQHLCHLLQSPSTAPRSRVPMKSSQVVLTMTGISLPW